jgi:outer membrane protein OmpA-like peptidoglycan-associated protein
MRNISQPVMFDKFGKLISLCFLLALLGGCVSVFNEPSRKLTPHDTIIAGVDNSDEAFIDRRDGAVIRGLDADRTEYDYTAADVVEAVYFDSGSADLSAREFAKIRDVSKVFAKSNSAQILVVGHCDRFGFERDNFSLGKRRSEAVLTALASMGIGGKRVRVASLGSTEARRSARSTADGSFDRRCDIVACEP